MSHRNKKSEIAKALPKWKLAAPKLPVSQTAPLAALALEPGEYTQADFTPIFTRGPSVALDVLTLADFAPDDQVNAAGYLAALLSMTSPQALAYRRAGQEIKNAVPLLMTPEKIGDATGYCDSARVFAYGYPYRAGCESKWEAHAIPALTVTRALPDRGGFYIEHVSHLLGATYRLDVPINDSYRAMYSGPRTAGHRQRVVWSGGGDFCFCCDCEGWDTVIARGTYEGTGIQLSQWRGTPRVWVGFLLTTVEDGTTYSGLAGFMGEPWRMFAQVLAGDMPSRVFVDWLCEYYRLPIPMQPLAERCGFNCERK